MTTNKSLINANQVHKTFTLPGRTITAIHEINFQTVAGEFFCVLGPSGCGKSTLLNLIAGLELPSTGTLYIGDDEAAASTMNIGMVFQEHALFPWMTLERNMTFILENNPRFTGMDRRQHARDWLHKVGLSKFLRAYPHQLSGGMRQRAAIARSFAIQPDLLLMDEPFVHLDYQTRMQSQQLLLNLWQEVRCTVVFVTHDIEEAVLLSDRIMIMSSHPGTNKEMITNELSRPRNPLELKTDPRFLDLVRRGMQALRHELQAEPRP